MGWKLFAGLNGVLILMTFWKLAAHGGRTTLAGLVELAISVLTLAGLVGYAFQRRSLSPGFWRAFAWLMTAWSLWSGNQALRGLAGLTASGQAFAIGKVLGVGLALAFTVFCWLGVRRYSEWMSGRTSLAA